MKWGKMQLNFCTYSYLQRNLLSRNRAEGVINYVHTQQSYIAAELHVVVIARYSDSGDREVNAQ